MRFVNANQGDAKRHTGQLPDCPGACSGPTFGGANDFDFELVQSEQRRRARRMPLSLNISRKFIPYLRMTAKMAEHGVTAGDTAVRELNDTHALAAFGSEPRLVFAVKQH